MKTSKITDKNCSGNFKTAAEAAVVRGKFFNNLIDDFNAHVPSDGSAKLNSISEYTSGSGVTVDSVLLKDGYVSGTPFRTQGAPVNSDTDPADKAVFAAGMLAGLLTATPAGAIDYTLPTGTQMDANDAHLAIGQSFDFSIINIGAGGVITFVAATGFTIVGTATVAANTSAMFRARKTAANTFVLYRIG